ncbi:MAG TPA: hypothetical protein VN903_31720 [Polyangia bacterium]|jgi:hypothetical protein|nr:hypothetical protein [Polyangia bacterium]
MKSTSAALLAVAFALSCGAGTKPSMATGVAGSGGTAGTGAAGITGGGGTVGNAGSGGAGTGGSAAGTGGRGGNLCDLRNGFVDPGPFEFGGFAYSEIYLIGGPPGGVVSYSIDKNGAVSTTEYGHCNGQAPADVLATFVQKVTSPDVVAPFLCDKPCQTNVLDAKVTTTLTLANRQTYADCQFGSALVSAGWTVVSAACEPRDAATDAPSQ